MAKGKKPNKPAADKAAKVRRSPVVPKPTLPESEPTEEKPAEAKEQPAAKEQPVAKEQPAASEPPPKPAQEPQERSPTPRGSYEQGRAIVRDWDQSLHHSVRQRPLYSLLIAAGVGWLLSLLLFPGNRRNED